MAYVTINDEDMPLTKNGETQVKSVAERLSPLLSSKKIRIFCSPSTRVVRSAEIIRSFYPTTTEVTVSNLIKKQDWGSVTVHNRKAIEKERYETGVLRYQFPDGENGEQFIYRFKEFANKLTKEISKLPLCEDYVYIIITHGFEFRTFLMCLLDWSEDYFESLAHPVNCEYRVINYENEVLTLEQPMRLHNLGGTPNYIGRKK